MSNAIGAAVLVGIIIGLGLLIYGVYNNWQQDMAYQREIGVFFEYADRASDAATKADYFNQYIGALQKYKLTEGCSALTFCDQPNALLKDNYKTALSLQKRLNELAKLDEKDAGYQFGMKQMTENEFCWFPVEPFRQKYLLDHGAWGLAVTPHGISDMCHPSSD